MRRLRNTCPVWRIEDTLQPPTAAENFPLKAFSIFQPFRVRLLSGVALRPDALFVKREAGASDILGDRGVSRTAAGAVGTIFPETPGQFILFSIKLGTVVTTAFP